LQVAPVTMPVEDPTVNWSEQESSFVTVATIRIPQQDFNTDERKQFDEQQSFSPWHTLPEQQPLGGVNRARKRIYTELAQFRNEMNQSNSQQFSFWKFFSDFRQHVCLKALFRR
jgi:hypothetical protein